MPRCWHGFCNAAAQSKCLCASQWHACMESGTAAASLSARVSYYKNFMCILPVPVTTPYLLARSVHSLVRSIALPLLHAAPGWER